MRLPSLRLFVAGRSALFGSELLRSLSSQSLPHYVNPLLVAPQLSLAPVLLLTMTVPRFVLKDDTLLRVSLTFITPQRSPIRLLGLLAYVCHFYEAVAYLFLTSFSSISDRPAA